MKGDIVINKSEVKKRSDEQRTTNRTEMAARVLRVRDHCRTSPLLSLITTKRSAWGCLFFRIGSFMIKSYDQLSEKLGSLNNNIQ